MLDYGTLTGDPPQSPTGPVEPDAVAVPHGHLDHAGAVPSLPPGDDWPAVRWTPLTDEPTRTLVRDVPKLHSGSCDCPFTGTHVRWTTQQSAYHDYGESFEAADHEVILYNAGHIPDSAHVLASDGETRLLHTADFHTDDQRLVSRITARLDADVVICEPIYSDMGYENRAIAEERFVESVRTTVREGGTVVAPVLAIGRTQELLVVLDAHDVDCYVDSMGVCVLEMFGNHPDYVRDAVVLKWAKSNARVVPDRDGRRKHIAQENSVIVTTDGMFSGRPAMMYIPEVRDNPMNKICPVGYQVEGTLGRELVKRSRYEPSSGVISVAVRVKMYGFPAHVDHHRLLPFLGDYHSASALVNHGNRCAALVRELSVDGYEATTPGIGATVEV